MKCAEDDLPLFVQSVLALSPGPLPLKRLQTILSARSYYERPILSDVLKELVEKRLIEKSRDGYAAREPKPPLHIAHYEKKQGNGDVVANPLNWKTDETLISPRFVIKKRDLKGHKETDGPFLLEVKRLSINEDGELVCNCNIAKSKPQEAGFVLSGIFRRVNGKAVIELLDVAKDHFMAVAKPKGFAYKAGDYVLAHLSSDARQPFPSAQVTGLYWNPAMPAETLSRLHMQSANISTDHPEDARQQSKIMAKNPPKLEAVTKNLKDIYFVTIDGEYAQDFDDAIAAEPDTSEDNQGGAYIHVAIADVARYVRKGTAIDRYMRDNLFTTYATGCTAHLLPEGLMKACSLEPDEKKYAVVWSFRLNRDGELIGRNAQVLDKNSDLKSEIMIRRGIIKSRARLTYEQVQDHISGKKALPSHIGGHIDRLKGGYNLIKDCQFLNAKDSLRIKKPEHYPKVEDGRVTGFLSKNRTEARELVEYYMKLTGAMSGLILHSFIGRTHARLGKDQIRKHRKGLESLGLRCPDHDDWSAGEMTDILEQAHDPDVYNAAVKIVYNMISPGRYIAFQPVVHDDTTFHGHQTHFGAGLSLAPNAHVTSPIRRYVDLENHRRLLALLGLGEPDPKPSKAQDEALAEDANDKLVSQAAFQNEENRLHAIAYLTRYKGQTVDARIVDVLSVPKEEKLAGPVLTDLREPEETPDLNRGQRRRVRKQKGRHKRQRDKFLEVAAQQDREDHYLMVEVNGCPIQFPVRLEANASGDKRAAGGGGRLMHSGLPDHINIGDTLPVTVQGNPLQNEIKIRLVQCPFTGERLEKVRTNGACVTNPAKKNSALTQHRGVRATITGVKGNGVWLSAPELNIGPFFWSIPGSNRIMMQENCIYNFNSRKTYELGQNLTVDVLTKLETNPETKQRYERVVAVSPQKPKRTHSKQPLQRAGNGFEALEVHPMAPGRDAA